MLQQVTSSVQRLAALVYGVVFVLVALLGFILAPMMGLLLGFFEVDLVHNLVHALFGIVGIVAAFSTFAYARLYMRATGIIYLLLGILGFIPGLTFGGMLLGIVHANIADHGLHLVLGAVAALIGFLPQFSKEPTASAA